jgi:hypothetical protein
VPDTPEELFAALDALRISHSTVNHGYCDRSSSYSCIGSECERVRRCQRGPRGNRTDLVDVWRRYLPAESADSRTSVTSATTEDDMAPHVPNVADVLEMRGEGGDLDDNPFGDSF